MLTMNVELQGVVRHQLLPEDVLRPGCEVSKPKIWHAGDELGFVISNPVRNSRSPCPLPHLQSLHCYYLFFPGGMDSTVYAPIILHCLRAHNSLLLRADPPLRRLKMA